MARPVRILHCHSTFALGGKEARAVRLMNAFGDAAEHVVLSAVPDALAAREAIDPGIRVDFPGDAAPSLRGRPGIGRYAELARYMAGFDLVLSYNWGAMDVAGAHRLFAAARRLPPLIHHEDGFNEDEAARQKPARVWFRRLMLPTAHRLVVPSHRLETIAREVWRQPAARVERIPNGIRLPDDAELARPLPIPGLAAGSGLVVGTVAGLRPVKNLARLVRVFAAGAPGDARLAILGEGPDRAAIEAEAAWLGIADRVILPGFVRDPVRHMAAFDVFALSSDSEQFPISLVEAMACGLPGLMTDVGDIAAMAAAENRPFIRPCDDEAGLAAGLARLAGDADLRRAIGAANRTVALRHYDEKAMIERYRCLYWGAVDTHVRR
ncbi:glycosyltransferase [Sphingomonas histidinilytica]|uniref:Glycosyltransferase involved in cell wall bisynthesis n=1 Tax=Rhizorhabdus histidinilytica TaxID=439228 RepID=A0A1T5BY65_9SPHN|nr:glycosyltransferase [Rhizorhabdus histidinilytica]MBO9375205.1 glycosyltransferase [Rhizorhabdus histidinilytica]SKB52298.1 Glycosyltransferase involved in cell wall bisynthesis [Rhizorhabdus histidinilytica]